MSKIRIDYTGVLADYSDAGVINRNRFYAEASRYPGVKFNETNNHYCGSLFYITLDELDAVQLLLTIDHLKGIHEV